jgi:hypothetical protein
MPLTKQELVGSTTERASWIHWSETSVLRGAGRDRVQRSALNRQTLDMREVPG